MDSTARGVRETPVISSCCTVQIGGYDHTYRELPELAGEYHIPDDAHELLPASRLLGRVGKIMFSCTAS